jgi:hypothetical protein
MKINPYDLIQLKNHVSVDKWLRVLDVIENESGGETLAVIVEDRKGVEYKINISEIAEVQYTDSEFIV